MRVYSQAVTAHMSGKAAGSVRVSGHQAGPLLVLCLYYLSSTMVGVYS